MRAHGYRERSVHHRVPVACCFSAFAQRHGATDIASAYALIDAFAAQWLNDHGTGCRNERARRSVVNEARSPVRQMLDLALAGNAPRHHACKEFPFAVEAPAFITYLRQERGLREATVKHYAHYLGSLRDYCQRVGACGLSAMSAPLLAGFVVDRCPPLSPSSRRDLCGVVRVFLRYCHREQLLRSDLSAAVEMPQSYRLASVPRAIGWDDVARLLAVVDRRTIKGRRDYSILLLLVTYGLRGCEVAHLGLDDIDWKREQLRIPDRKAGHCTAYPLATVVAQAIIDYLKEGRPATENRHLFFRVVAPMGPITSATIASAVSAYLLQAGIEVPRGGSHTLRHTCVQRLIDAEFPLKTIGDYVGHRSPDATAIYAQQTWTPIF